MSAVFQGVFPSPHESALLLSSLRKATQRVLPFPLRDVSPVDAAAAVLGYSLLVEFDDNCLTLAIDGRIAVSALDLSPQAEAVAIRAAGCAAPSNLELASPAIPDEALLEISSEAAKWAAENCGLEYAHLVLLRTASDLSAKHAKSNLLSPHAALAATLNLLALDL